MAVLCGSYSAGVRYCADEIVWHNIDPSIVAGFYIVRVPGIVRVNFRYTYPHYVGPPTVTSFPGRYYPSPRSSRNNIMAFSHSLAAS